MQDSHTTSASRTHHSTDHPFFDRPNPTPKRRKPMEQLIAELAERNGDPVFPVAEPVAARVNGHQRGGGRIASPPEWVAS